MHASANEAAPDPGWHPHHDLGLGVVMPALGCGTQYGFTEDGNRRGEPARAAEHVVQALRAGFRLVDTARSYGTEAAVLAGIRAAGLDRERVFVVTKAWPGVDHEAGAASSRRAIAESAARLGGRVDLFLVHQPVPGWQDLWRELERARDDGVVRAIGVSNFWLPHLQELAAFARHRPVANQVLLHPFVWQQYRPLVEHCQQHGIRMIAYPRCPWRLGQGTAIDRVATATGMTRAQVMLRWLVERGVVPVPLSADDRHLAENFAVRDLRLEPTQVADVDRAGAASSLFFHVDVFGPPVVAGWAFSPGGIRRIRVLVDGVAVGDAVHGQPRPDVQQAHGGEPEALASGFAFRFAPDCSFATPRAVVVEFELQNGDVRATPPRQVGGG